MPSKDTNGAIQLRGVRHNNLKNLDLDLPKGKHTLQLAFANFAHILHKPAVVSKKITITVE